MNKHTLKTNGIRLIPVKENIPDGPEGIILESLLEGFEHTNGHNVFCPPKLPFVVSIVAPTLANVIRKK